MSEHISRIWHKDLIKLLPDSLLICQLEDCIDISNSLQWGVMNIGYHVQRLRDFMPDEFYTYYNLVKNEVIARRLDIVNIDDYDKIFLNQLSNYAGRTNFSIIDYNKLYQGWHSTRLLQQDILALERMYDNNVIELKDWFKIVNGVRSLNQLGQDTFDTLFC